MIKISGLDELSRQFGDVQKVLETLEGELSTVNFNPYDPASIEAAIQSVEAAIDEKTGQFASNPIIVQLTDSMKEQYRESIIERAAAARLENGKE